LRRAAGTDRGREEGVVTFPGGRRALALLALVLSAFLLGGCWDYLDLERRGLVMAMAVDTDPADSRRLRLAVELPAPAALGPSAMDSGAVREPKIVMEASGVSLIEAGNELRSELEREPLWTQVIAVAVGEAVAREGVARVLDPFMRWDPLNPRAYLYLVDGEARGVLRLLPSAQPLVALALRSFADQFPFYPGMIRPRDVASIHRDLQETGSAVAPRVVVQEGQLRLVGGGVLKGGTLVGWLDAVQAEGTNCLLGWVYRALVQFDCPVAPAGQVAAWARLVDHRVTVAILDGRPRFHVRRAVSGRLVDLAGCPMDPEDPADLSRLTGALIAAIRERAMAAVERAQGELQVDYLRLGELVRRHYPGLWRSVDWQKLFPHVEIDVQVEPGAGGIESPGLLRRPVPYN